MLRFKTTEAILRGEKEYFDENWMDSPFLQFPNFYKWDYSRELKIEDIDIWEIITEVSGGTGIYAAWMPYAEFYVIVKNCQIDSTYYGIGSDEHAANRCDELFIPYHRK